MLPSTMKIFVITFLLLNTITDCKKKNKKNKDKVQGTDCPTKCYFDQETARTFYKKNGKDVSSRITHYCDTTCPVPELCLITQDTADTQSFTWECLTEDNLCDYNLDRSCERQIVQNELQVLAYPPEIDDTPRTEPPLSAYSRENCPVCMDLGSNLKLDCLMGDIYKTVSCVRGESCWVHELVEEYELVLGTTTRILKTFIGCGHDTHHFNTVCNSGNSDVRCVGSIFTAEEYPATLEEVEPTTQPKIITQPKKVTTKQPTEPKPVPTTKQPTEPKPEPTKQPTEPKPEPTEPKQEPTTQQPTEPKKQSTEEVAEPEMETEKPEDLTEAQQKGHTPTEEPVDDEDEPVAVVSQERSESDTETNESETGATCGASEPNNCPEGQTCVGKKFVDESTEYECYDENEAYNVECSGDCVTTCLIALDPNSIYKCEVVPTTEAATANETPAQPKVENTENDPNDTPAQPEVENTENETNDTPAQPEAENTENEAPEVQNETEEKPVENINKDTENETEEKEEAAVTDPNTEEAEAAISSAQDIPVAWILNTFLLISYNLMIN